MRQSGIGVVGRVPWGTHLCLVYDTSDDITETLVPFFREGLEAGESCVWITSAPLTVKLATKALGGVVPDLPAYARAGQVEILDFRQWYGNAMLLARDGVPGWFLEKTRDLKKKGFAGLRFADNPSWLQLHGGTDFTRYETLKAGVLQQDHVLALSAFAARNMTPKDVARLAARHRFTLIRENGAWEALGEIHPGSHHRIPIVTDTSAKMKAEEERDRIWNLSRDILCIMDSAGNFRDVNPAFRTVLGFEKHEVVGKKYTDFLPAEDVMSIPEAGKPFDRFLTMDFVNRYQCRDGKCRWLEWSAVPVTSDGLIYATARDITDRRTAYEELRKRNAELQAANTELSVAEEELRRKHAELNSAYDDIARSQAELRGNVAVLSDRERELSISESNLRHALEEKEVLLAEVHHRVKNNLTAFISLLSLEGGQAESEAVGQLKRDLRNRARSMALIHETLYLTKRYSSVDMGMYLGSLVGEIAGSSPTRRSIRTIVDADGVILDLSRATPCGLIINELVTNSLRYAFPYSSTASPGSEETIRVALTLAGGMYTLTVADNGIGLPPGYDPKKGSSVGLKLVNFLARHQLQATVDLISDGGTAFSIRFGETVKA